MNGAMDEAAARVEARRAALKASIEKWKYEKQSAIDASIKTSESYDASLEKVGFCVIYFAPTIIALSSF